MGFSEEKPRGTGRKERRKNFCGKETAKENIYQEKEKLTNKKRVRTFVKTQVFVENTGVIEEMILKSALDIGVVEGTIKSSDIICVPVVPDKLTLVCSPFHEFSSLDEVDSEKLHNRDFVLREEGSGTRELFEKSAESRGISINKKWICNNSEAIKNAVINGEGLTVISERLVKKELECGELHAVKIRDMNLMRSFSLAYHKNKYLSDSLRDFIESCTNYV